MTVWPVIDRELRVQARHAPTYWLRVVAALLAIAVFLIILNHPRNTPADMARFLFGSINAILFVVIWVAVPLLTADCLSRERREGTLGLLFLTPLTAGGVVLGKSLAQLLRAATLLLAVIPVLAIAFLLGGLSWEESVMALLCDLAAACLAIAAGVTASAWSREWHRAVVLAAVLAALAYQFLNVVLPMTLAGTSAGVLLGRGAWGGLRGMDEWLYRLGLLTGLGGIWTDLVSGRGRGWTSVLTAGALTLVVSMLVLWLGLRSAARRVARFREDAVTSARAMWWRRVFLTPRFWTRQFRSRMRRSLDRNPVGWLQRRTATARLTMWGWCLLLIVAETSIANGMHWRGTLSEHVWIMALLVTTLSMTAANSFRSERETGAIELLLVTGLTERQLIWGRVRGIWSQYVPALAILALGWFTFGPGAVWWRAWYGIESWTESSTTLELFFCSLALLPVVGVQRSLVHRTFLGAWLSTMLLGVILPLAVLPLLMLWLDRVATGYAGVRWMNWPEGDWVWLLVLAQATVAWLCYRALWRDLKERRFSLAVSR